MGWEAGFSILHDGEEFAWSSTADDAVGALAVLAAAPQDVSRVGVMPAEGVISAAPLGEYDVLELSIFAKPAARVRWWVDQDAEESWGMVSEVLAAEGSGAEPGEVGPVLVEAALDELWQEGADRVLTVVPVAQAPSYEAAGWERTDTVVLS